MMVAMMPPLLPVPDDFMLATIAGSLVKCPNGHTSWRQTLSESPAQASFRCTGCQHEITVPSGYAMRVTVTPFKVDALLKKIAEQETEIKGLRETMQHIAVKVREAAIGADIPDALVTTLWALGTDLIRMAQK